MGRTSFARALAVATIVLAGSFPGLAQGSSPEVEVDVHAAELRVRVVVRLADPGPAALLARLVANATGEADEVRHEVPAGPAGRSVEAWLAALDGPGDYRLLAEILSGGERTVHKRDVHVPRTEEGHAEARAQVTVEEPHVEIVLTNDDVNRPKNKTAGSAVVTRARVRGSPSLGIDHVTVEVFREGLLVEHERIPVDPASADVALEHRYERSPLREGSYVLRMRAGSASVDRTFSIVPSKPAGQLSLDTTTLVPDRAAALRGFVSVASRNFGSGPLDPESAAPFAKLEVKLWSGSRLASEPFELAVEQALRSSVWGNWTLSDRTHRAAGYRVADGLGLLDLPFAVHVPAAARAGFYRASAYVDGTLVGSATFELLPVPRLKAVRLPAGAEPGQTIALSVDGDLSTAQSLAVELLDAKTGSELVAWTVNASNASLSVALPAPLRAGPALVRVSAFGPGGVLVESSDGTVLNRAQAALSILDAPPRVEVAPARNLDRGVWPVAPRHFEAVVNASDPNGDLHDSPRARILAPDGTPTGWNLTHDATRGSVRFEVPALARHGRYQLEAEAVDASGRRATALRPFEVGPVLRLAARIEEGPARASAAGTANWTLLVQNLGNVDLPRLHVDVRVGNVSANGAVRVAGTNESWSLVNGRAVIALPGTLQPHADVRLVVEPTLRGIAAGAHELRIRVVAPMAR
ncbi:MAG TPA: hypothetical protein VM681_02045 [Candidatus Thermoplasmatota archaeon]|nr:hypothetical protein [Candidatus Thermoplasmatota archaeon]